MKTIFFDLDDTLYFRQDAFFQAFTAFFKSDDKELKKSASDRCRIRGDEVFYQSQRGIITMQEMYIYRFQKGFRDVGIELSDSEALDFHAVYKQFLYSMKLNPNVISMLDFAKSKFNLGIITNGPSEHQRNKIHSLGLEKWINPELIVISGEHGFDKPEKELFKIAEQKSCKKPENLIIIGDSYKNDIIPASELGWHTIWLNLYDEKLSPPEYTGKNISEIQDMLKNL